jgi:hypothetical protein
VKLHRFGKIRFHVTQVTCRTARLITFSQPFRAALKKQWTEGQTRVIRLPEESPESVQQYVAYLYGRGLPTRYLTGEFPHMVTEDHHDMLAELYVLGERVLNAKHQNMIIYEMLRLTQIEDGLSGDREYPGATTVNIIYGGTTPDSPFRRLLVDLAVAYGEQEWLENPVPDSQYLLDLGKSFLRAVTSHSCFDDFRWGTIKAEDYLVGEEA